MTRGLSGIRSVRHTIASPRTRWWILGTVLDNWADCKTGHHRAWESIFGAPGLGDRDEIFDPRNARSCPGSMFGFFPFRP